MLEPSNNKELPTIPSKKYFTIGEVASLCEVKSHVLRYWEQEFFDLKPVTRRGNRRYYQQHDVLLIRKIRRLLYQEGFTISGAVHQLEIDKKDGVKAIHFTTKVELKEIREKLEDLLKTLESR